jgi:hypothetical protein
MRWALDLRTVRQERFMDTRPRKWRKPKNSPIIIKIRKIIAHQRGTDALPPGATSRRRWARKRLTQRPPALQPACGAAYTIYARGGAGGPGGRGSCRTLRAVLLARRAPAVPVPPVCYAAWRCGPASGCSPSARRRARRAPRMVFQLRRMARTAKSARPRRARRCRPRRPRRRTCARRQRARHARARARGCCKLTAGSARCAGRRFVVGCRTGAAT